LHKAKCFLFSSSVLRCVLCELFESVLALGCRKSCSVAGVKAASKI